MNVLLIEPDYRSSFPPLGLMRISAFHKERGDSVTFARGKLPELRLVRWHRIYVSSLFTYELPRTVRTVAYYLPTVDNPLEDIYVGGIGATLLPAYVRERVPCHVVEGALDRPGALGLAEGAIAEYIPDYGLLDSTERKYKPQDAYFIRISTGCIRRCRFCAVPKLEPRFGYLQSPQEQLDAIKEKYGERQNLVVLDNNILALDRLPEVIAQIRDQGFEKGAKRGGRKRTLDFNQGIDARLMTADVADLLSSTCLQPVRLAFDHAAVEHEYRRAVGLLADKGFTAFTTYVMYNFEDTPETFYHRLSVNLELSQALAIKATGFPMRYVPINDVDRHFVSPRWTWRYLRGIQCILNATHGVVSPNPSFFDAAFGRSCDEFLEVIAMPDRYVIQRRRYEPQADQWRADYRKLSASDKAEFLGVIGDLRTLDDAGRAFHANPRFRALLAHYCPDKAT